jgi:hypothetical protein
MVATTMRVLSSLGQATVSVNPHSAKSCFNQKKGAL